VTPVRIGLAGYGRGGRYFHAPLIGLAPECILAAVVTQNPQRRADLAEDFPGVSAVGSLGDLAAAGAGVVRLA
jgi:predicted dehydrogenase